MSDFKRLMQPDTYVFRLSKDHDADSMWHFVEPIRKVDSDGVASYKSNDMWFNDFCNLEKINYANWDQYDMEYISKTNRDNYTFLVFVGGV